MRGLEQLSVTWSMAHTRTSVAWTNYPETVLVMRTQEKNSVLIIILTLTIFSVIKSLTPGISCDVILASSSCRHWAERKQFLSSLNWMQAVLVVTELNASSSCRHWAERKQFLSSLNWMQAVLVVTELNASSSCRHWAERKQFLSSLSWMQAVCTLKWGPYIGYQPF